MDGWPLEREPIEWLVSDFVQRSRQGERPMIAEYTTRFPEHAEQIADLFPVVVQMERLRARHAPADARHPSRRAS